MRTHRSTASQLLLSLVGSVALVATLTACGDGGEEQTSAGETTASDEATTDGPTSEDATSDDAGEDPSESGSSDEASEGGTPGIEDVPTAELGDCLVIADLVADGGEGITELPVIDCAEEHDAQVFAVIEMPEGDYPGDDAVKTTMSDECTAAFEGFVGTAPGDSALAADGLSPTAETWAVGDREILCLAFYPDLQTTTESFEGSGL